MSLLLNVNGLNNPVKRQRSSYWKKSKVQLYAVYRRHFRFKDTNRLKVKEWKKISNHQPQENTILISDKINFKTKECY